MKNVWLAIFGLIWALTHCGAAQTLQGRPLKDWIALLDDLSPSTRRQAASVLGTGGSGCREALPALRQKLGDPDVHVEIAAAHSIFLIDQTDSEDAVIDFLINRLRSQVSQQTGLLEEDVIEALGAAGPRAAKAVPLLKRISGNNRWPGSTQNKAYVALTEIAPNRGTASADHSQEAIQAVTSLLNNSTVVQGNKVYVNFTIAATATPTPRYRGFAEPLQPRAASQAVPSGMMEITLNGQFNASPLNDGPGSDWNEQVTIRVYGYRIYQASTGWGRQNLLMVNFLQWTVAASNNNPQVAVRSDNGATSQDEGIAELVARIFNVPIGSVAISKPQPASN